MGAFRLKELMLAEHTGANPPVGTILHSSTIRGERANDHRGPEHGTSAVAITENIVDVLINLSAEELTIEIIAILAKLSPRTVKGGI